VTERIQLEQAIAALEAQRALIGDAVVDAALTPLRQRLDELKVHAVTEQRKQVTVLFADVSGFTAMGEKLDAEDVRDIMRAYFERCSRAITSYGGVVEKFIGDAVMAVFGVPSAQESDPENAVRAALAMRQALDELNIDIERQHGFRLGIRTGITTGPVVVSFMTERAAESFAAVGDTVNLASRLEHAAPTGGILISHDTYRHVHSLFDMQPQPPLSVKGKQEPVRVYLVQNARPRTFRFAGRGIEGITTPMIGRAAELQRLQEALHTTQTTRTTDLITISGAAGLGKSRLIAEFTTWIEQTQQTALVFKGRADQRTSYAPYALVRDLFLFYCDIRDGDSGALAGQKLQNGVVQALGDAGAELTPLIGHLIGLDVPSHTLSTAVSAKQMRDHALDAATRFFNAVAQTRPTVLTLEDLHWADQDSLTAIERLADRAAPLLVLCTTRPSLFEERATWGATLAHTRLDLQPLTSQESHQLMAEMLRKAPVIPTELYDLVATRAEGNPFYLEELLKMFIEDGVIVANSEQWLVETGRLAEAHVPPTLTGILQARLDGLPATERDALQRAAVVGRIFWDGVVGALVSDETSEPTARRPLEALAEKGLIVRRETSAFSGCREYAFGHALLHEVTYARILKRQRRDDHAQVAAWLIAQSNERVDEYAGQIGEHFERAGEGRLAADWYRQATRQAQRAYAPETAIAYYRRILDALPEDTNLARTLRRVEAYEGLSETLLLQERFAEAETALVAMRNAAEGAHDEVAQARAWYGLAEIHERRGDYRTALDSAGQAEELARTADARRELAVALQLRGWCLFKLGALREALALGEQALLVSTELDAFREMARSMNLLAAAHTSLEQYQQAAYYMQSALVWHRQLSDQVRVCGTLTNLGDNAHARGEYQAAATYYQEALELAREIKQQQMELTACGALGCAQISMGDDQAGADNIQRALAQIDPADAQARRFTCYLAEARLAQGQIGEALTLLIPLLETSSSAAEAPTRGLAWRVFGALISSLATRPDAEIAQLFIPPQLQNYVAHPAACFTESIELFRAAGLEGERARSIRAWAVYERRHGDQAYAAALQQQAQDIFAQLGVK
jgi:predicted ATPase/class 3 adenylate cyclase